MTEKTYTKVQPGKACKVAALLDAQWGCPESAASWQQATDPYGNIVAYHDSTGWWVAAELSDTDVSGILA
jgi:hypothetical protein